jgi:hypothetical protein
LRAAALDKPVLYVPGNHESYCDNMDGALALFIPAR